VGGDFETLRSFLQGVNNKQCTLLGHYEHSRLSNREMFEILIW